MGRGTGLESANRLRIAVVIVLATISYWLAVVLAAIATTLTFVVVIALKVGDLSLIPDTMDELKVAGFILLGLVVVSAVVGTFVALFRLPSRRRQLEQRVLTETGARIATPDDYPRVRNLLSGLAIAADVPEPRFAIITDPAPNSFGVGTRPEHTIIGITSGLVDALTRDELEAVLAYEVSRIGSWDIALSSWTVALTGSAIEAVDRDGDDGPFHSVLGFVPRTCAQWLQTFAVKDQLEERDRIAIQFTRNPMALLRALEKLHADTSEVHHVTRATAPLWLEFPAEVAGSTRSGQRLAAELALDGRIDRLREQVGMPTD
jgi:heat shock protein HtpX